MTNITENNIIIISEEDKLELFDEIMCKIQSKKNENSTRDYLTDFIDFIELYNISNEDDDYIYDYPFHYTDIKNLTILEEFYEIVYYITNYDALDDSFDLSEDNCLNNYIYYDFNECPKKIFSEIFINELKIYLYTILNLVNTLK